MIGNAAALPTQARADAANWLLRVWYWSVRRELWESRSLYIAPMLAAAVFFLGFLITAFQLPDKLHTMQRQALATPYDMAAGLLMLTAMVVGGFYCVEALQSERRDRSILFWKSFPVSDRTSVLAKAAVPLLMMPLLTFAITFVLQVAMLITSIAVLAASGVSTAPLLTQLSFPRMTMLLLYHLLTVHALWEAPLYAWLLLVSAWARRAALLWVVLPPVAIGVVESLVFNTSHFANMLEYRLGGGGMEAMTVSGTFPMDPMTHPTPGTFLTSSGLWIGLLLTAVFLETAVWLRRRRGPNA